MFLGITVLIFVLTRLLPGDPVRLALGPNATAEMVEHARQVWNLDKPLYIQYLTYLSGFFMGNWGISLRTNNNVLQELVRFAPASYELIAVAVSFATIVGIPLGVVSAVHKDEWEDHSGRLLSITGISMPLFWIGIVLQVFLASYLKLVPIGGRLGEGATPPVTITGFYLIDSLVTGNWNSFWNSAYHIALPAFVLSFPALANISRLVRSAMVDERGKDYVLLQTAYGMPPPLITYKYMLRNSLSAALTMIALMFAYSLGSVVLVETVFFWPGIGYYLVDAIFFKDLNAITSVVILVGVLVLAANFIVDLLYGYVDPRIRYGEER
jgi:peptide/nickel transport system permease protein